MESADTLHHATEPDATEAIDQGRRQFFKRSTAGALTLSMAQLGGVISGSFVDDVLAGETRVKYDGPADLYRDIWQWDKVTWGTHTNACVPNGCSFRVYVKDGIVWREEQSMKNEASNPDYPDYNPLGCQKGCSFHANLYSEERITHPMKRVGPRGSGEWQRVSWDDALTEIAESIVDGIEEFGPDSYITDGAHFNAGGVGFTALYRFNTMLGGVTPDWNVMNGDIYQGLHDTFGKMLLGYSGDNLMDAELIIMATTNWSYTNTPLYHFITEARYNGSEFVSIAPDYSPSTIHADYHVPVKPGGDAAFWLGMCQVMIEQDLLDREFMRDQTDLALLRRKDTGKFLRQPEVDGEGRTDQFYSWDTQSNALKPASRSTLAFDGEQALEGEFEVTLSDGSTITVEPVFAGMKRLLAAEYTPEKAGRKCGVHPSLIERIGRKMGTKRTLTQVGWGGCKVYHSDLSERSMLLAGALSGNWGKPGTGQTTYAMPADHMELLMVMEQPMHAGGLEMVAKTHEAVAKQMAETDPVVTPENIGVEMTKLLTMRMGWVPPAIFLHNHCGYDELYNNKAWQDPALDRTFTEYLDEAVEKGWWKPEHLRPAKDKEPRVMAMCGGNPLRKIRSAAIMYPKHLFPKLKMMFAIEPRMSYTALHCDIVLPAAWYYEKSDISYTVTGNPRFAFIEEAVKARGESRKEWDIFADLAKKIGEVATRRGLESYKNFWGQEQRYDELWKRFTMDGHVATHDDALQEMIGLGAAMGVFPKGATVDTMKEVGMVPLTSFGQGLYKDLVANEYDPKKPFYSLRWHVDDKVVYPTHTRRAQFLLDHDWYMEAGEDLPVYKEAPKIGGDHPFSITGGHPRHSIHATHLTSPALMRLHRGQPVMHMNDKTAAKRGIKDGETVEVFNDFSDFRIMVRTTPTVAPMQVIVYMWEGHQFEGWKVFNRALIGQPKPIHLAGGYEQFRYYAINGSPSPAKDRSVRVDVRKIS
ncbi:MAG: molybdopterin-dependent oxidoreductase [Gammaproteobacteria bacterium]